MDNAFNEFIEELTHTKTLLSKIKKKPLVQVIYLSKLLNSFLERLLDRQNFLKQFTNLEMQIIKLSSSNTSQPTNNLLKPTVDVGTNINTDGHTSINNANIYATPELLKELTGSYELFKNLKLELKKLIIDLKKFVEQSTLYMKDLDIVEINLHSNTLMNEFIAYCDKAMPRIDGFLLFLKNILVRMTHNRYPLIEKFQITYFQEANLEVINNLFNYDAWEKRVRELKKTFFEKNGIISAEYRLLQELQKNKKIIKGRMINSESLKNPSTNILRNGDIIVGYKLYGFFRINLLSRAIANITKSAATHLMMYYDGKIIEASLGKNRVLLTDIHDKHNEILLVFRPKLTSQEISLLDKIIPSYLGLIDGEPRFKYSYKKLIGFYFKRKKDFFTRFFKNNDALFCSELIDMIFKDLGHKLTLKNDSSTVSPKDIIESSFLNFMYIIDGTNGVDSVDDIDTISTQISELLKNDIVTMQY